MKITYYGYNAFIIEIGKKIIGFDPGGDFYLFKFFKSLIPKSEWQGITHLFVTHGDPDHYWHTDRVVKQSQTDVICNRNMIRENNGKSYMLATRKGGLTFNFPIDDLKINTISANETLELDGITVTGIKTTHGPLRLKIWNFEKTVHPGPDERLGWGSLGYDITINGKRIVNLGDTILHTHEWESIKRPDILMIPIGGKIPGNTMDEEEAITAVKNINPQIVIPCHYDGAALIRRKYNKADVEYFKHEIEKLAIECKILNKGESIYIN
ncbi:MAG: MBL fold metallo-hydrolase [Candidatus Hodarchaeales archaeon]